MNWQDYYAVAKSLRARAEWLFARGETSMPAKAFGAPCITHHER